MIQFFINNIEIVLPDDFEVQHVEENTLITQSGEYTLDIDVSLNEPQNLRALKHVSRLNIITLEDDYEAIMIRNNKVVLGKFIRISNTNTSAKLQFVAGSSEVVYLTGEDKKIWEYDFGTEAPIDFARALNSITNPNWQNKFICNPVKFANVIGNDYLFPTIVANNSTNPATFFLRHTDGTTSPTTFGAEIAVDAVNNIVMNVYLMYVIDKLIALLGYSVTTNVLLNSERAKHEVLINRTNSLKYADALPDKTVREFISDIEVSYNVVFNFKGDRTVEIINTHDFIKSKNLLKDAVIVDDYSREKETNVYRFDFTNLFYEFNSNDLSKYQKLDKSIVDACSKESFSTRNELKNYLNETLKNKFTIYTVENSIHKFVFTGNPQVNVYRNLVSATSGYILHVDKFGDYFVSDEKSVEIKIKPIAFVQQGKQFTFTSQGGTNTYDAGYQLPFVNSELYIGSNQTLLDAIETDIVEIPRVDAIEVCLYSGLIDLPVLGGFDVYFKGKYPISYLDDMPEFWITDYDKTSNEVVCAAGYETWIHEKYKPVALYNLRITGVNGIYESYFENKETLFETDYIYVFQIEEHPNLNVDYILVHEGHSYIPIKLERTISKNNKIVPSYFYRLKN